MINAFSIDLGFTSIITFLLGIVAGVILICLIIAFFMLSSIKKYDKIVSTVEVPEEEIIAIIKNAQENYKVMQKSRDKEIAKNALQVGIKAVTIDIAKKYYPNSKKPLFELTLSETLLLVNYIYKRLDGILQNKIYSMISKKMTVKQVMDLLLFSSKVNQNKIVKFAKRTNAVANKVLFALTVINPLTWIKKGVSLLSSAVIVPKLMYSIINVVGEETYRIYSKNALKSEEEAPIDDKEFDQLLKSIDTMDDK
jgi:hypothetical protein